MTTAAAVAPKEAALSPWRWFGPILGAIAVTNIAVFADIPVLRQVAGFAFLTFVPGFLLLRILKLDRLGWLEQIVLSVGLSVSFSMLFGLAVNGSLLAAGYATPLATAPLLASFSAAVGIMAVIAYIRNRGVAIPIPRLRLTALQQRLVILLSLLPLASIFGMRLMNLQDSNTLLLAVFAMIIAAVIYITINRRRVSEKVYPFAIFSIGISLLLMYSLRSNHIIGSDVQVEYYTFLATVENLSWSQRGFDLLDGCLSTSLLPAIYKGFINVGPEYLYKTLYSILFSVAPLAVYLIARRYVGGFYAFLAAFFFMAQQMFLWTPGYARTNIAILFFALAVMTMFIGDISRFNRSLLFIIFTASVIVSHYGVTYATFFILILTWIGIRILPGFLSRIRKSFPRPPPARDDAWKSSHDWAGKGVTITMIALFFTILFFWYSEVIGSTFSYGVRFVYDMFAQWQWFLSGDVGGQPVQAALGRSMPEAVLPQRIEFVFSWLSVVLVSLGLLTVVRRHRAMVADPASGSDKDAFLVRRFGLPYLAFSIACFAMLVATVVMPYVSENYGPSKNYFQMMVPLSVFFVIGGMEAARYIKTRPYWVLIAVMIPFFLSTTGVSYQVLGAPKAITLTSEGPLYSDMYLSDAESSSAKWLKKYGTGGMIYVHGVTRSILLGQGEIPYRHTNPELISRYEEGKPTPGYIYLRRKELIDDGFLTKYPGMFAGRDRIYANGSSEIYR